MKEYELAVNSPILWPTGPSLVSRLGRLVPVVSFVAAVTLAGAVAGASSGAQERTSASDSIYWGAYINGSETYRYLYGLRLGNAPWDATTWSRFESNAGKRVSIVHWGLGTPWRNDFDSWWSTFELVRARGDLSLVDMTTGSVPLRQIADGRYDAQLRKWMHGAAFYAHPFFLNLDVEMNGNWEPYSAGKHGNTPADFVRMWRHVHDIAVESGATNITWVWAPNVDPRGKFTPYWRLYPGAGYVDWTGLDGFNANGKSSFAWLFGSSYRKLLRLAPTKPMVITQTGAVQQGDKARWIVDMLTNQLPRHFPQIKALVWFNWRILERRTWMSYEIESSASSQAAFANAIASSYYSPGGSYGNLPLHSKISPP